VSSLHFSLSDYFHRLFTILPNFAPCQTLLWAWTRSPSSTAAWSCRPSSLSGSSPLLLEAQLDTNTDKRIDSTYTDTIKIEYTRFRRCNVSYVKLNICDSVEIIFYSLSLNINKNCEYTYNLWILLYGSDLKNIKTGKTYCLFWKKLL
jgi:hypothetical protein